MNRRTRGLAAGVAALSAGAILVGPITALAQSDDPDEPAPTSAPDAPDAADASSWLQDTLAPLVESGTLTQEQVDAVVKALRDARPVFDRTRVPHGRRGPGDWFGRSHSLSTAAETIGISDDELREALDDGQTIAEVAESNGVEPQAVIDALIAEATERLDDAVADGRIDDDDADERRDDVTERITDMVHEGAPAARSDHTERPRPGGPWHD